VPDSPPGEVLVEVDELLVQPGHYRVLREGKPLRKTNGMPFTLPFSPDTIRWRRAATEKPHPRRRKGPSVMNQLPGESIG
jgi:hypothetical protein